MSDDCKACGGHGRVYPNSGEGNSGYMVECPCIEVKRLRAVLDEERVAVAPRCNRMVDILLGDAPVEMVAVRCDKPDIHDGPCRFHYAGEGVQT